MQSFLPILESTRTWTALGVLFLLLLWESVHPFFEFFRGRTRERVGHDIRNLLIGLLNAGMVALLFAGLWLIAAGWAESRGVGLLNWASIPHPWHLVGAILLLDMWTYFWHWLNHKVPFFWRFHRLHHSDPRMDVTTANRFHLGEIFFSSLFRIPLIVLFGVHFWELVLYETLLFAVVQFHHANIGVPERLDRILRVVIVTPAMHKVHHSNWRPETDSNYTSLLSVWDRLFRTFRLNPDPHAIQFGLKEFEAAEHHTLTGLMKTPLVRKPSRRKDPDPGNE